MPTYQYVCTNADDKHEFEVVQSFTDAPVSTCPTCGAPVRKVYGSVGVVFKGSGFYRTDSRAGSNGSPAKETSKASSESSASSSSEGSSSTASSTASSSTPSTSGNAKAAG